jgi:hypothetical protein
MKIDIWVFFKKSVQDFEIWLKSDENNGHFTWRPLYICDISLNSS